MKQFAELKNAQGGEITEQYAGFWSVPAKVKPFLDRAPKHRTPKVELEIQQNAALRARWLHHIKPNGDWCEGSYIARVHFHREVLDLGKKVKTKKGDRLNMPSVVPKKVAESIAESIGDYTDDDKIPGCEKGDYFPVPNCDLDVARAKLHEMQASTSSPHPPPVSASSKAVAASSSPVMLPPYPKLVSCQP